MDVEIVQNIETAPIHGINDWLNYPVFANVYLVDYAEHASPEFWGGPPRIFNAYWKARLLTVFREHPATNRLKCMPLLAAAGNYARRYGELIPGASCGPHRDAVRLYVTPAREAHYITKIVGEGTVSIQREVKVFTKGDYCYGVEKVGNFLTPPARP